MNNNNLKPKFDLLLAVLKENMKSLKEASKGERNKAFWMKLSIVVLSTSVTFILGMKEIINGPHIALFISCIVTILTTMDQFLGTTSNFKVLEYRLHLVSKLTLDVDLYTRGNEDLRPEKWDEFKERFDQILDESNKIETEKKESKEDSQ